MQKDRLDMKYFGKDALAKLKSGEGLLGAFGTFMPLLKDFFDKILEASTRYLKPNSSKDIVKGSEPDRQERQGQKGRANHAWRGRDRDAAR